MASYFLGFLTCPPHQVQVFSCYANFIMQIGCNLISSARNLICADCWLTALSRSQRVPAHIREKPAGRQVQHPGATLVVTGCSLPLGFPSFLIMSFSKKTFCVGGWGGGGQVGSSFIALWQGFLFNSTPGPSHNLISWFGSQLTWLPKSCLPWNSAFAQWHLGWLLSVLKMCYF